MGQGLTAPLLFPQVESGAPIPDLRYTRNMVPILYVNYHDYFVPKDNGPLAHRLWLSQPQYAARFGGQPGIPGRTPPNHFKPPGTINQGEHAAAVQKYLNRSPPVNSSEVGGGDGGDPSSPTRGGGGTKEGQNEPAGAAPPGTTGPPSAPTSPTKIPKSVPSHAWFDVSML